MDRERLRELLEEVRSGALSPADATETLRRLPFERLDDIARIDHHRELRSGVPEVVLGEWKSADDIASILEAMAAGGGGALATRVAPDKAERVLTRIGAARYRERARIVEIPPTAPRPVQTRGAIAVVSAGTSDLAVAEEAAVTAEFLGHEVARVEDAGVAGLPRVVAAGEAVRKAAVAIVVAGMEGALPSVLSTLVECPVVAVPTSVGYGVGLGGFVAMLSMLSSCAPGVTVVNIDNGFGAAVAAVRINRRPGAPAEES